jgi:hypothetical protein
MNWIQAAWDESIEVKSWLGQEFSILHIIQTGSGVHPASYTVGTGGPLSGGGGK